MPGDHFSGQCWGGWSSPLCSVKLVYVVLMLCLNINTLHFEKQIWLGKLLKYLKCGLLKLLPHSTLRQKLYAVRGRNCIFVLMPVNAVCCCHLLPPGCRCWCHSAWWHGSFVGISADGLWQEWAKRGKKEVSLQLICLRIPKYSDGLLMNVFDNYKKVEFVILFFIIISIYLSQFIVLYFIFALSIVFSG